MAPYGMSEENAAAEELHLSSKVKNMMIIVCIHSSICHQCLSLYLHAYYFRSV